MRAVSVTSKAGSRSVVRGTGAVVALLLALAVPGCGRNQGAVPPGFSPEGSVSPSNFLIVEVTPESVGTALEGRVQVTVYDRTQADGYRLYRRAPGAGYAPAVDYPLPFAGTFNQGFETFTATDFARDTTAGDEYVARGTVGGIESTLSPLTNTAFVPGGPTQDLLPQSFAPECPIDTVKTDSLPLFRWAAVPGAARYLLRLVRSDARVFFFGMTADATTHYQLGSGAGTVIQQRALTRSSFFWTVRAIDDRWRIIGRSPSAIFSVDPLQAVPPCTP